METPVFMISKPRPFAPAGSLRPNQLTVNNTLAGITADTVAPQGDDLTNGWFTFTVGNGCGLELRFVGTGAAAAAFSGRVWTENLLLTNDANNKANHYTKVPLFDLDGALSASAVGVNNGAVDATYRWGTGVVVSSDGGLLPAKTRVMQHPLAESVSRLIIDPVCEMRVLVQLLKGAATGIGVVARPWQRS